LTDPILSRLPNRGAIKTPTNGTAEISRPARELDICFSAVEMDSQGTPISMSANIARGRHLSKRFRKPPRRMAIGNSTMAAIAVRRNTSVAGVSSWTAMRMNRYGIPQITHIATKRRRPRRVIPHQD